MPHAANHKAHSSSLFGSVMARLSARIAPLVRAELSGALIMELERHFNERLLSELHERVKAIVARELEKREAVIDSVLPIVLHKYFKKTYGSTARLYRVRDREKTHILLSLPYQR